MVWRWKRKGNCSCVFFFESHYLIYEAVAAAAVVAVVTPFDAVNS